MNNDELLKMLDGGCRTEKEAAAALRKADLMYISLWDASMDAQKKIRAERDELIEALASMAVRLESSIRERENPGATQHYNEVANLAASSIEERDALRKENEYLRHTLHTLACIGNGTEYGNSIGNVIAQDALAFVSKKTKWP